MQMQLLELLMGSTVCLLLPVQETRFEHVLCVPLTFCETIDAQASQPFLCSCDKMKDQVKAVQGMGTSSRPSLAGKIQPMMCEACMQFGSGSDATTFFLVLLSMSSSLTYVGMPGQ